FTHDVGTAVVRSPMHRFAIQMIFRLANSICATCPSAFDILLPEDAPVHQPATFAHIDIRGDMAGTAIFIRGQAKFAEEIAHTLRYGTVILDEIQKRPRIAGK